ncbi:MAG: PepSY domain-containing protein [Marinilabiliales bacterium]|nr:PepSY domain-containing protein [Marinilabiliales bacterium]
MKPFRIVHRYLGFFLAGIMAVYAISGIVMIFRDTDFLKSEKVVERTLKPGMEAADLGRELRQRNFKVTREENGSLYFENGEYNKSTGVARVTQKELPSFVGKLVAIHKARSGEPLFFLNLFFAVSLLFFVVSAFWMFPWKSKTFRNGLYFALGGLLLTVVLLLLK